MKQGRLGGRKYLYCIGRDQGPVKFGSTVDFDKVLSRHQSGGATVKRHFAIYCPVGKAQRVEKEIKKRFGDSLAKGRSWYHVDPEDLFDCVAHELSKQRHPLLGRRRAGSVVTHWIGSDWDDRVDLFAITADDSRFSLGFLPVQLQSDGYRVQFDHFVDALEYAEEKIFNAVFEKPGNNSSPVAHC